MLTLLLITIFVTILSGFPVAFAIGGVSIIFIGLGILTNQLDLSFVHITNAKLYGIMTNQILIAVPLFILMGTSLQRSHIAEDLLAHMSRIFTGTRSNLSVAVVVVGALLAASTGIVGATVVTMGLIALPGMLKNQYDPAISCGTICAAGTLGQIIPPSIILVLLGDVMSNAHQVAQNLKGNFGEYSVSVVDLFAGAFIPGLILVGLYALFLIALSHFRPELFPSLKDSRPAPFYWGDFLKTALPSLLLIVVVLGSILAGMATPTEASATGAVGALLLTYLKRRGISLRELRDILQTSTCITCMVFMILISAALFSLCFRGLGGDDVVHALLSQLPGGSVTQIGIVMLLIFVLGFFLESLEITLIVVPIVAPVLLLLGIDPIWLGIMIAINLQTSFLTPPFGFALFYLRGVAPASVKTGQIYRGVMPFILLQLSMLALLATYPQLATWLPRMLFAE